MARSHPPTLLKLAQRTLREECDLEPKTRILAAVSGGPDSMALLHVLSVLSPKLGFDLVAHGVDHGLRPEASAELDLAERAAQRVGVPFSRSAVLLPPGGNVQARARDARYSALRQAARELSATLIATAHHADDRAETVLLRLLRGAGPRGLAVLPARDGTLLRPLIRARRADVALHLSRHRLPFAQDPSNEDRRYARVRVRTELIPLLEQLSPRVVEHLNALADQIAAEPPPVLTDEAGAALTLSRAHIMQIRRAQKLHQRGARIRLPGSREARIDPHAGVVTISGRARSPDKSRT